jgi:hypothetical protein
MHIVLLWGTCAAAAAGTSAVHRIPQPSLREPRRYVGEEIDHQADQSAIAQPGWCRDIAGIKELYQRALALTDMRPLT